MFGNDLPVWLIEDWTEVVDSRTVYSKLIDVWDNLQSHHRYNFDKIYATGWIEEIEFVANDAAGGGGGDGAAAVIASS
jgi:hypothetical protein